MNRVHIAAALCIAFALSASLPVRAANVAATYRVDGKVFKKNLKKYEGVPSTVTVGLYDNAACTSAVQEDTGKTLAGDFLIREEMRSRGGIRNGDFSNGTKKPTALVYVFEDVDLSGVTGDALYVAVTCESGTDCPIDTALAKSDTDFSACQPVAPLRPPGTPDISVRVYNSAAISTASDAITTPTFDSERWDTCNMHTGSEGILRPCVDGKYLIFASVEFAPNGVGERHLNIARNGAAIASQLVNAASTDETRLSVTTHYDLITTDEISITVLQRSGGPLDVRSFDFNTPEFGMVKLP